MKTIQTLVNITVAVTMFNRGSGSSFNCWGKGVGVQKFVYCLLSLHVGPFPQYSPVKVVISCLNVPSLKTLSPILWYSDGHGLDSYAELFFYVSFSPI